MTRVRWGTAVIDASRSSMPATHRSRALVAAVVFLLLLSVAAVIQTQVPAAAAVPAGFAEMTAFSGLVNPTAVRFAPDGRIFVAEKRGTIQMYDGVGDTSPVQVADLRTEVHNFWDRGLLGLAIDPDFPARPYLYALYTPFTTTLIEGSTTSLSAPSPMTVSGKAYEFVGWSDGRRAVAQRHGRRGGRHLHRDLLRRGTPPPSTANER
jgi:glucose/arabinose dehydrogenase